MQRFTSVLAGVAVSLAMAAASAPAQATSLRAMPAVLTDDGPTASIQTVHDTRWRHRHRDRGPHFSFGFAAPLVPFAYTPHVYTTTRCSDGFYYRYPVGCVAYGGYHSYPYYSRPGVSLQFGF